MKPNNQPNSKPTLKSPTHDVRFSQSSRASFNPIKHQEYMVNRKPNIKKLLKEDKNERLRKGTARQPTGTDRRVKD